MTGLAPAAVAIPPAIIHQLSTMLQQCRRLLVITGAGCSTESGIPDYRSPNGSLSRGHKPITYPEFVKKVENRQRYWSRAYLGWDLFSRAKPNAIHHTVAKLEALGKAHYVITQNVDGLHLAAGSRSVSELHGNAHYVTCLKCGTVTSRLEMQYRIADYNPDWANRRFQDWSAMMPDGDAETSLDPSQFQIPDCLECGGILKPHVVMFGENIPKDIVETCFTKVDDSDAVLVLGTSLEVPSIFRYIRHAHKRTIPIIIGNIGPTRGDELAHLKITARCGDLADHLSKLCPLA